MRWYAYLAVTPFDNELALFMRRAGCVGIDFTGDAASPAMLRCYAHPHTPDDLTAAVDHCHRHGIAVMIDLLLGGPGETPQTVAETLAFIKKINPDCIGAPLGLRLYENTPAADLVRREGPLEENPGICRKYSGPVDFFQPTFYISPALGERPAALVRDLIDGDPRFFAPEDDTTTDTDHNYNDNTPLVEAIAAGARGAYWHILHQIRGQ